MDRFAVFVDAGYFFAAGAYAVTSSNIPRRNISLVSAETTIKEICGYWEKQSSTPALLRVYWYDAMMGPRPSMEQSMLAHLAGVKLRLGSLNNAGEQKGVDSLIVTDLIELARNRAISDAILISGDEDLRIAVQLAQTFGVRVHILAVGDAARNVSPALKMEADSLETIESPWLKKHLSISTPSTPSKTSAPTTKEDTQGKTLEGAASLVCKELLDAAAAEDIGNLSKHLESSTVIPPEFDRRLIAMIGKALGRQLTSDEKRKVRGLFVNSVRARL